LVKDSRCKVCADADAIVAVGELRTKGLSIRDIATKLRRPKSSIARHIRHAEAGKKSGSIGLESTLRRVSHAGRKAGRDAAGRCPTCGLVADDADPKALILRAERALHYGETIVMKAVADDDDRLALQGLDRIRSALELLMRCHGMLAVPDGQSTTKMVNIFAGRSLEELGAILNSLRNLGQGEPAARETAPKSVTDNQYKSAPMPALPSATAEPIQEPI
jgi:hypothetical protein